MQVDQSLVDAHLKAVPGVGTFSGRSLTSSNPQDFGGKTDRSAHMKFLIQRGLLQVGADFLQVLDVARSQSDADAVNNLISWGGSGFFLWWEGHLLNVVVMYNEYFRLDQKIEGG